MPASRGAHRIERVTVTLTPLANEKSFRTIPTTFSPVNRTYGWRQFDKGVYMLVPRRVSHSEIQVDLFLDLMKTNKKTVFSSVRKIVEDFVVSRIRTEWRGLKLSSIGKPTEAEPPTKAFKRSTIEEIMGVQLEG